MTTATTTLKNVKRAPIKVVLADGKEREIKFTLNTMAELEDKYGSVDDAFKILEKGSIKAVRFFLWCTMQQFEGESLSEFDVANLIDMQSLGSVMDALTKASSDDMPDEEDIVDTTAATIPN